MGGWPTKENEETEGAASIISAVGKIMMPTDVAKMSPVLRFEVNDALNPIIRQLPQDLWAVVLELLDDTSQRQLAGVSKWFFNFFWTLKTTLSFKRTANDDTLLDAFKRCNPESVTKIILHSSDVTNRTCQHLKILDLTYCDELDDQGMYFLKDMFALRSLAINYCPKVTSVGMDYLSRLTYLEELEIGNTSISFLENMTHLKKLYLMRVRVPEASTKCMSGLTNLWYLNFGNTSTLTDTAIQNIGFLPSLKHLNIMGSAITNDALPVIAANFPSLRTLNLSSTKITSADALVGLQFLTQLILNRTYIRGSISYLTQLTRLEELELSGCPTIIEEDVIRALSRLRRLLLYYNTGSNQDALREAIRGVLILGSK